MIGINFSYPDPVDAFRHPPWTELRVSRIEPGPPNRVWSKGDTYEVQYYWRNWNIPLEERTRLMADVVQGLVNSHKVDGFTLWWNWSKKMWQMNHRYQDGGGWSVSYISQEDAEKIFATLTAAHPDGPWKVKDDYVQDDKAAHEEIEKEQKFLNPAATYVRGVEDLFDAAARKEGGVPLLDALKRAAEALERADAILGRVVA